MGASPSRRRLRQFVRYAASTFCMGTYLRELRDRRRRVEIPGSVIGAVLFVGFALRVGSLMQLDRWVREGALGRLLGRRRPPLRDCIRDWTKVADPGRAWAIHDAVLATARRNKSFRAGTVHGWHVVALDGSEVLRTSSRYCPGCQIHHHKDGRVDYVHRILALQTVVRPDPSEERSGARGAGTAGGPPPVIWGIEAQQPKEGEVVAGRRLLRRIVGRHGHFADVVTADALYAEAPFLNEVRELGLHAVVRLKDERYSVMQDAAGLRRHMPPQVSFTTVIGAKQVDVTLWDTPGLTTWKGLKAPIRVVRAEETVRWNATRADPTQGNRVEPQEQRRILEVATTLTPAEASARVVWEMARARWGVENKGFRELKDKWHLAHGFLHHPTGMQVLWAFLSLGFNLFQLFLARRIRRRHPLEETDSGMVERLRAELLMGEQAGDSWLFDTS